MERVLHVDLPVPAEGLPGLLPERAAQRGRPGVEHQDVRPVGVDELPGHDGIGGVGGDGRDRAAELGGQLGESAAVAGHRDHVRAGRAECRRDAAAQAPAGAGDDGGGS